MSDKPKRTLRPQLYLDHEKEEAWLNRMASRGWYLYRRGWLGYYFQQGAPDQYTYRVRLLPDWAKGDKRHEYFDFMWESGVEVICKAGRWCYFRKPTADGAFELAADVRSMIRRATRIAWTFAIPAGILLPVGLRLLGPQAKAQLPWASTVGWILLFVASVLAYYALQGFNRVRELAVQLGASKR